MLEFIFFGVNFFKIYDGGYVLILIVGGIVIVMWIWCCGSCIFVEKVKVNNILIDKFIEMVSCESDYVLVIVLGIVIFFIFDLGFVLVMLLYNIKYNYVFYK